MKLEKSSKAFILAGGTGSRLWPLSSRFVPKQFLRIFSDKSLFQETVLRNLFMGSLVIIVNEDYLEIVEMQLSEMGLSIHSPEIEIIIEPERKNTAASAILASCYAKWHNIENIAIVPCDHIINNQQAYQNTMKQAVNKLDDFKMVAIGINPDCFSPEYGYVKAQKISEVDYKVQSFVEKPLQQPQRLFNNDSYYFWNAGIYWLNANYIIEYAAKYWQNSTKNIQAAFESHTLRNNITYISNKFYQHVDKQSFDIIFSEKIASMHKDTMTIVKASFDWSDVGSWKAMGKKIIETYPINSCIKHEKVTNDISTINKISDLQSFNIYDFAPKIIVLEDDIVIIHDEYLCILDRKNSYEMLKIKKDDFLNSCSKEKAFRIYAAAA